eukprot:7336198-Ditylum_brightwellii.AAC.1
MDPSTKRVNKDSLNSEHSYLLLCLKCIKNGKSKGKSPHGATTKSLNMTCIDSPNHYQVQC